MFKKYFACFYKTDEESYEDIKNKRMRMLPLFYKLYTKK